MKDALILYLSGVFLAISLVLLANVGSDPKKWEVKYVIKSLLCCLGSWLLIYLMAIKGALDNKI